MPVSSAAALLPLSPLGATFLLLHTQIFKVNLCLKVNTHQIKQSDIVYYEQKYTVFGGQTLTGFVKDTNAL